MATVETHISEAGRYEAQGGAATASLLVAVQLVLCLLRDTGTVVMSDGFTRLLTLLGAALSVWVVLALRHFAAMRGMRGPFSLWVAASVLAFVQQAVVSILPALQVMIMSSPAGRVGWYVVLLILQLVWVVALVFLGYGLYVQRHDFFGDLFMALGISWTLVLLVEALMLTGVLGTPALTGALVLAYNFASFLCYVAFHLLLRRTD